MKPSEAIPANSARKLHTQALQALQAGRLDDGIALLEKALALNPGTGAIHDSLGTAYWKKGELEQAQTHYIKATNLSPRAPQALTNYGSFLMAQGRLKEAEKLLVRALRREPGHSEALNNMGRLALETGRMKEAERLLIEAIKRAPRWASPHYNLGNVLALTKRLEFAEKAFRQALSLDPLHADAAYSLGTLLSRLFRDDEALPLLQQALQLNPQSEEYRIQVIVLLEKHGRIEEAEAVLKEGFVLLPDSKRFALAFARLLRRKGEIDGAITALEATLPGLQANSPLYIAIYFELGQLYDRTQRYEDAFKMLEAANKAQACSPEARSYSKDLLPGMIRKYMENNTKEWAASWTEAPPLNSVRSPVFLVGFPRSGTTLLDQILSSHPDVTVAEEKPSLWKTLTDIEYRMGPDSWPSCFADMSAEHIQKYRQAYMSEHAKYRHVDENIDEAGIFVDKLPLNLIHMALILRLFPDARFILALRHPCDSVLSCFMQKFQLNESMIHYLDLDDAAKFYDAAFKLWVHDTAVFEPPVHTIRYEDVVTDFRGAVGAMLDFLGLPWDDAVLEYDQTAKNRKALSTPSYHQVTEKIYTRASGRWLHYRKFMGNVPEVLRAHAERFGYDIDE